MGLPVPVRIEVLSLVDANYHQPSSKINDCLSIASAIIESLKRSKGGCSDAKLNHR